MCNHKKNTIFRDAELCVLKSLFARHFDHLLTLNTFSYYCIVPTCLKTWWSPKTWQSIPRQKYESALPWIDLYPTPLELASEGMVHLHSFVASQGEPSVVEPAVPILFI